MNDVTSNENRKIQSIPTVLKAMQQSDVRPRPHVDPDSLAAFIITSGTTG
jgi:long-subunit acyl-CoA synthetase (AMP-forming)